MDVSTVKDNEKMPSKREPEGDPKQQDHPADATSSTQTPNPTQNPAQNRTLSMSQNQVHTALQNQNQPLAVGNATSDVVGMGPHEVKSSEPNQVLGKVRTLTFECPTNNVFRGYVDAIANKENQIQMVLKKNFSEEMVDTTTVYGHNVNGGNGMKVEQSFPKSQKAHLHAQQFIKLVENDGYFMITDVVENNGIPMSPTTSDIPSILLSNIEDIHFLAPFDHKDPFAHLQAMTFQEEVYTRGFSD